MNKLVALMHTVRERYRAFIRQIQRTTLTVKLITAVVVTIVVILSIQAIISLTTIQDLSQRDAIATLQGIYKSYNSSIDEASKAAASVALSIAQRDDVQRMYLELNRDSVYSMLNALYRPLSERYQMSHMYIINADGTVFLRIHDPSLYGDSVTYRRTAATALYNREVASGVEVGPNGLGIRGVAPMFRFGEFIGLSEVGLNFDTAFFSALKERTEADFTVWVSAEVAEAAGLKPANNIPESPIQDVFFYNSTSEDIPLIPAEYYENALTGAEAIYFDIRPGRESRIILITPLYGFAQRILGVMMIYRSYEDTLVAIRNDQISVIVLAIIMAAATSLAIYVLSNISILKPLNALTKFAELQVEGQSSARVKLDSGDEFQKLGDTFNIMAESIDEQRQELEQRVSARTRQLEAINEVGRVASAILEPDTLISQVVNLITNRFGYYYAAIFLVDSTGQWAELHDATGAAGKALKARRHRLAINNKSMVGAAINTRNARIALDVGLEPVRFNNPFLPDTRSEIALPLIAGNRVIGALDVQSTEESAFNNDDINTLQNMANQVAIAVENARLFQETSANLDEIRSVHRQYLTSAWQDRTRAGNMQYTAEQPAFSEGEGVPADLPLLIRDQAIGRIVLEMEDEMTSEQRDWVQAIASQVATALENARLVEESQQMALRERLAAAITEKIWSSVSVEGILQTTVREIGRALDVAEATIEITADELLENKEAGANNG